MIQNIINGFQKIFSYSDLTLDEVFEVDKVVDGDGVICIQVNNIQRLNPQVADYRLTILITGQTYIDNDPTKAKINQFFIASNRILTSLTAGQLKNQTGELVEGYIFKQSELLEAESTRGFSSEVEVYVCDFQL